MSPDRLLQDDEILELLSDLKEADQTEYPANLMNKRRAAFLAQVAGLGVLGALSFLKIGRFRIPLPTTVEGWVAAALTTALVAEMGYGIIAYRAEIGSFLFPLQPTQTQVVQNPSSSLKTPDKNDDKSSTSSPIPSLTITSPSPTMTASLLTATPTPDKLSPTMVPTNIAPTETPFVAKPTDVPTNNGLHIGQTKTPKPPKPSKTPKK